MWIHLAHFMNYYIKVEIDSNVSLKIIYCLMTIKQLLHLNSKFTIYTSQSEEGAGKGIYLQFNPLHGVRGPPGLKFLL